MPVRRVCARGCSAVPKVCRYGPPGSKHCETCNRARATCTACGTLQFCPYAAGTCQQCYRAGLRAAALADTGKLAPNLHAELAELQGLCARMLLPEATARIELWILPLHECLYIAARGLIWTELGRFAGLVQGPPEGVVRCRSGGGGYCTDPAKYAAHIEGLRQAGRWPPPPARVVCCGLPGVAALATHLPAAVADQLCAYRWSLSGQPGPPGAVPLADKARAVLDLAGLAPSAPQVLTGDGALVTLFRSLVYP